jgi:hypothetical protein
MIKLEMFSPRVKPSVQPFIPMKMLPATMTISI